MKQCKASIHFRGKPFRCDKRQEHDGPHVTGSACAGIDYNFAWSGDSFEVPWPEPKPSLSEMSWSVYKLGRSRQIDFCPISERKAYGESWKAALQAVRGKLAKASCATHFYPNKGHVTIVAFDEILDECK